MRCSEDAGSRAAQAAAPHGGFRAAGRSHKIAIPDRHRLTAEFSMPSPDCAKPAARSSGFSDRFGEEPGLEVRLAWLDGTRHEE